MVSGIIMRQEIRQCAKAAAIKAHSLCALAAVHVEAVLRGPEMRMLLTLGTLTAVFAVTSTAFAQATAASVTPDTQAIDEAICWLLHFQRGSWGALLAAATGISALVSAAIGNYKAALSFLAVCLGSYMPEPLAELYFGSAALDAARSGLGNGCAIAGGMQQPV